VFSGISTHEKAEAIIRAQSSESLAHAALELTTLVGCPLMCTFCPQEKLRKNYDGLETRKLTLSALKVMLSRVSRQTRIDFSGMSEPWANEECTSMLRYVLEEGFRVAIYTTLYGMSAHDAEEVRELCIAHSSQVEVFCVHLPDKNKNMRGWRLTAAWMYAYQVLSAMPLGTYREMTMDGHGEVDPVLDGVVRHTSAFVPIDRAGSLGASEYHQEQRLVPRRARHQSPINCKSTPYYNRNVVFPNGDVVLCCMDYERKHILGNLLTESMDEILFGSSLAAIREINERPGYSDSSICKRCSNARAISG
jgi:radical SAM protein with 4Fe4S-binding SPASM domain